MYPVSLQPDNRGFDPVSGGPYTDVDDCIAVELTPLFYPWRRLGGQE